MIELNKIYNENCIGENGMKHIPDKFCNMVLCDLPFGTTQNKWDSVIPFDILWNEYKRIIKDDGVIVLFGQGMFTAEMKISNKKMWRYDLIWKKNKATGHLNAKKMPMRAHEDIEIFSHEDIEVFYKKLPTYNPQKTTGHPRKVSKAEHKINCKATTNYGEHGLTTYDSTERYPLSVLEFPVMNNDDPNKFHPTQKPVELYEYLIKTFTTEGDIVLDNCSGAGTIAIASINTNRNYIGFEMDKDYYEKSQDWIRRHIDNQGSDFRIND